MAIDPVDPVALLTVTLSGLSRKQQAATLERVMRVYMRICQEAYPDKSVAEIAEQFRAIAKAATERAAKTRTEVETKASTARLAKMMAATSAETRMVK